MSTVFFNKIFYYKIKYKKKRIGGESYSLSVFNNLLNSSPHGGNSHQRSVGLYSNNNEAQFKTVSFFQYHDSLNQV